MNRKLKIVILLLVCMIVTLNCYTQESDLKERYAEWIDAWNNKDAKKIAEISWGNYGVGRDVPFMRKGATSIEVYEKGIKEYLDSMEEINYKEYYTNYRVIDYVGLVDGFYAQTTQQKNGVKRTIYGRQSIVFLKRGKKWKMEHYHRSPLPNEFVR